VGPGEQELLLKEEKGTPLILPEGAPYWYSKDQGGVRIKV